MTGPKLRPTPGLANRRGLGKSDRRGQQIETPKKAQPENPHNGEPRRLSNGQFLHDVECWNLLTAPWVAVFNPIVCRVVVLAERGDKDCSLCDANLSVGFLSAVLISHEPNGKVIAQGCCRDCMLTLGFEKACQAMGRTFLDQCCGGGEVLIPHPGTDEVH